MAGANLKPISGKDPLDLLFGYGPGAINAENAIEAFLSAGYTLADLGITASGTPAGSLTVRVTGIAVDGTANAAPAIHAAIDLVALAGGGTVQLPAGTIRVDWQDMNVRNPSIPAGTYMACIMVKSGVTLTGVGRKTVVRAGVATDNASVNASVICNHQYVAGGDTQVRVHSLTVDGNKDAQPTSVATSRGTWVGTTGGFICNGVSLGRVAEGEVQQVKVLNVRGGTIGGGGETFCVEFYRCGVGVALHCDVQGGGGTAATSSGFSSNYSTLCSWTACTASSMGAMGFTMYGAGVHTYTGCRAWLNGSNGFNREYCGDVTYVGCISGGETGDSNNATAPFPTARASLGNTGAGFTFLSGTDGVRFGDGTVTMTGCISRLNGTYGVDLNGIGAVTISGCDLSDNQSRAINTSNGGLLGVRLVNTNLRSVSRPNDDIWWSNASQQNADGTQGGTSAAIVCKPGQIIGNQPVVPNSLVPFRNPYGIPVAVHIIANGATYNASVVTVGNFRSFGVSLANGSTAIIGGPTCRFSASDVGRRIVGTNIPAGTTITAVADQYNATLSAAATGASSAAPCSVFDAGVSLGLAQTFANHTVILPPEGWLAVSYSAGAPVMKWQAIY